MSYATGRCFLRKHGHGIFNVRNAVIKRTVYGRARRALKGRLSRIASRSFVLLRRGAEPSPVHGYPDRWPDLLLVYPPFPKSHTTDTHHRHHRLHRVDYVFQSVTRSSNLLNHYKITRHQCTCSTKLRLLFFFECNYWP